MACGLLPVSGGSLARLTHRVVGRVPLWPVGVAPNPQCLPGALTGSTQPTHTVTRLPLNPQLLSVPSVLYGSLWTRKHPPHHLYACYRSRLADEQTEAPREMGPHRQVNGEAGTTAGFSSFHCWERRRKMVSGEYLLRFIFIYSLPSLQPLQYIALSLWIK